MFHCWGSGYFFFPEKASWISQNNVLPPIELKLLVMWERIGVAVKMVYSAYQFAQPWQWSQ
jgi:hypothetical protein